MYRYSLQGLLLLAALPVHAATLTQTFTATLQLGDNLPEGLDQTTFSVDRFDPGLGTLTGVSFALTSSLSAGATFYNGSADFVSFAYTPVNYVSAEFLGLINPPGMAVDRTLATQTYTDQTAGGGSYWVPHAGDLGTVTYTSPTLLKYRGGNPYTVLLTIEDRGTYSASDPLSYINDKYVISDVSLVATYSYTPAVPEPETWALLASGLALVGLRRSLRNPPSLS